MKFMELTIRAPQEINSLILQTTQGCVYGKRDFRFPRLSIPCGQNGGYGKGAHRAEALFFRPILHYT